MLDFGFYNMDCLEGMRQFPDNYFELAIVDPPYGDGGGPGRTERDSDNDSTDTSNRVQGQDIPRRKPRHKSGGVRDITLSERENPAGPIRTGGTWASKFGKKSSRGTLRRISRTLTNCSASHATRLYGGGIISIYLRQGVSWYGAN